MLGSVLNKSGKIASSEAGSLNWLSASRASHRTSLSKVFISAIVGNTPSLLFIFLKAFRAAMVDFFASIFGCLFNRINCFRIFKITKSFDN